MTTLALIGAAWLGIVAFAFGTAWLLSRALERATSGRA